MSKASPTSLSSLASLLSDADATIKRLTKENAELQAKITVLEKSLTDIGKVRQAAEIIEQQIKAMDLSRPVERRYPKREPLLRRVRDMFP